jgi:hypothetical protein
MLCVVAVLALPGLPVEPMFQARVVSIAAQSVLHISDARNDLSAAGYSSEHGSDWFREEALCLLRGKSYRVPGDGKAFINWMPHRIDGSGQVSVRRRVNGEDKPVYRRARTEGSSLNVSSRSAPPSGVTGLRPTSTVSIPFPRGWWSYRYPNEDTYAPGTPLVIQWFTIPKKGISIGNGTYRSGPPPDVYQHAEGYFPLVKIGGKARPLKDYVKKPADVDLGQVAFVSPDGWFVVGATRGEFGRCLVWLSPIKRP